MQLWRILFLLFVAFLGDATPSAAAEMAENDADVEGQVAQGIALRRSGNDEAALAVFLDLEKRDPDSVRVLLHISTAALAAGRWLLAYDYLQKASLHKDDPYYQRHRVSIENVERTIAERVGQFRARGTPAGAVVRLSGEVIGALPMDSVKAIEVGTYTLEVSRPGYFSLRRPITITGHGSLTQEAIELRPQTPPQGGGPSMPGAVPVADTPAAPTWLRARWVTWALAGAAAAAATTSGVALAVREEKASQWNDNSPTSPCLSQTSPSLTRADNCGNTVRRDLKLAEGIGIGAGIAAGALAAGALLHWLVTRGDQAPDRPVAARAQARCSPAPAGVVCFGSF